MFQQNISHSILFFKNKQINFAKHPGGKNTVIQGYYFLKKDYFPRNSIVIFLNIQQLFS